LSARLAPAQIQTATPFIWATPFFGLSAPDAASAQPKPTFALITLSATCSGLYDLEDDEAESGAIIRRPGQPDRRVIGLLDLPEEDRTKYDVLIVQRV
jgi:hypothetical protein